MIRGLIKAERIDERKLWALLVVLAAIFLVYPLAASLGVLRFYRLALIIALGQATYSVSGNRLVRRIALSLGIPASISQVLATSLPGRGSLILLSLALTILFLAFIAWIILRSVFRPGRITADRIAGAICLYLIAGLLWAMVYGGILLTNPAAFNMPEAIRQAAQAGGEMTLVYFSFVTLTTLGYGDITPVSPLAQTFVWFQAVAGQLYTAILLARLVSLHVAAKVSDGLDNRPD